MSAFLTPFIAELIDDASADGRGTWEMAAELDYQSDVLQAWQQANNVTPADGIVRVPIHFRTDFASIPRLPIVFLACGGRATRPSVPHDYGYSTHYAPKPIIDKMFLESMLLTNVPLDIAHQMYSAVVLFGKPFWNAPNSPQTIILPVQAG